MDIAGYTVIEQLSETEHSRVYLAQQGSEKPVLLKCSRSGDPARTGERMLRNEFQITEHFDGIIRPLQLLAHEERIVLVRPFLQGSSLRKWASNGPDMLQRLRIAVLVAQQLEILYQTGIIHRDLKPDNIIVAPGSDAVTLIDYSHATKLSLKTSYLSNPERLEGTLSYRSPEQSGRMNRIVDYRCDLYALGVILYELFAGQLPFRSDKPLEVLHGHLAKKPQPPTQLNPELPPVLERIILKLLAKNPEDRYQSATRLRSDLEQCHNQWAKRRAIYDFPIAEHDIALSFKPSARLYGRAEEHAMLMDAFHKVVAGRKLLLLIGGFSGSGKTALVHDMHIPISAQQGFFASGKFEQYQRNLPYFAWKQAMEKWVEWLLTEDAQYIAQWRQRLQQALGDLLGVLHDLVPGLEKITGPCPAPPELSALENQNRFNYVARTFLKTVCSRQHPLVLFLDDLQWADAASLNLLRVLMTEPGLGYVLLICAYRENETPEGHPFLKTVDTLHREWLKINALDSSESHAPDEVLVQRLSLGDLSETDVANLISDTIPIAADQAAALARAVFAKTRGNAYFSHRLLESLYQEGAIRIETEQERPQWRYDAALAAQFGLSDNVIALLERKVERLSARSQGLLRKAACIGLQFDLYTLSIIAELSPGQVVLFLREALEEELILPLGLENGTVLLDSQNLSAYKYQFAHDRVRQAVYTAIPQTEKQALHLQAGLLLLETLNEAQQEERIFELVNHLNEAGPRMQDRQRLAEINFRAGLRAKTAIAYGPAYDYCCKALENLPKDHWTSQYAFSLEATNHCAEAAALNGDYAAMEPLIASIMAHAQTPFDKVDALDIRVNSLFFRQKIDESIAVGIETLASLGLRLPTKVSQIDVLSELLKTNLALRGKNPEDLLTQPLMSDPKRLAILRIISKLAPAVFFTNPNLFVLLNLRMAYLNVRYGTSLTAAYAYANYAFIISVATGQLTRGAAFGKLALDLMAKFPDTPNASRTYFIAHFFVSHWTQHSRNTLESLKSAYHLSMTNGEADFTAFLGNAYAQNALLNGIELAEIEQELRQQAQYAQQTNPLATTFNGIYQQFVHCLLGKAPEPHVLFGDSYDPAVQSAEITGLIANQSYYQLLLSLFFGDYQAAMQAADLAQKSKDQVKPVPIGKHLDFLDLLAVAHSRPAPDVRARKRMLGNLQRLKKHAKNCPEEYAGKLKMAEACFAAWEGRQGQAMSLFQEAEIFFKKEGNIFDQALAYLEMYRFHEQQRHEELSRLYLQKAILAFQRWGADAVVAHLEGLRDGQRKQLEPGMDSAGQTQSGIDVDSLAKGAQVISSELDLAQLVGKMLAVMSENAGAGRGALLLNQQGRYQVGATIEAGEEVQAMSEPMDIGGYAGACTAILNYVLQSGQSVVLEDAAQSSRFGNDPYIRKKGVRSVLCMNLVYKGANMGLLYLENNLASGAFTPQRLEVLNILGAQAAISLENARYYQDIQNLNRAYERFVPQRFLQQLGKTSATDIRRGDQAVQDMAVMFSDIWGFTALAEHMPAAEVFSLLNEVWGLLTPIIERNGGIVDKYIGDAVMALFPQNADGALRAAVEMQSALLAFNAVRRQLGLSAIEMGIGLNYGAMILGTVGSESRMDTTVIGDAVNVAARLETVTRRYQCRIVFHAELLQKIRMPSAFHARPIGSIELRGRSQRIALCEEFSNDALELRQAKTAQAALFQSFLDAQYAGDSKQAALLLKKYRKKVPDDAVAQYYEGLG